LILAAMAYGGSLELMQSYCYIDRSGSWFDFLANSLGAMVGVYFFKKLFDREGKRLFFRSVKK
jgi:VanZ family protein